MTAGELQIHHGLTVELRCQGCHQWFTWTASDENGPWWHNIPAYHGRGCKKRRRRAVKGSEVYSGCPRPEKRLYRTEMEAETVRLSLSRQYLQAFTIYHCICGGIHIGRVPMRLPVASSPQGALEPVGDTGIEPVTSSVSGKRATAAPIARVVLRSGPGVEVATGFEPV